MENERRVQVTLRVEVKNGFVEAWTEDSLAELLERIERVSQTLADKQLSVLSFSGSTLDTPIIVVAAHPKAYAAFAGATNAPASARMALCVTKHGKPSTWSIGFVFAGRR